MKLLGVMISSQDASVGDSSHSVFQMLKPGNSMKTFHAYECHISASALRAYSSMTTREACFLAALVNNGCMHRRGSLHTNHRNMP